MLAEGHRGKGAQHRVDHFGAGAGGARTGPGACPCTSGRRHASLLGAVAKIDLWLFRSRATTPQITSS